MDLFKSSIKKVIRFIEIDLDYLNYTSVPYLMKLKNIFYADVCTMINFISLKKNNYLMALFNNLDIKYDTKYATKTFLSAAYDFYQVTNKLSIFSKQPVIIDVGANIGQFLFSVKSYFPNARIYSVEPDPDIFKLLAHNVKALKNTVIFNRALSDRRVLCNFYKNNEFSEWSSLIKPRNKFKKITTLAVCGDELFKKIPKIDLVKIDVEGAEYKVVKGMLKTIRKAKYLLIEVSILRNLSDLGSSKLLRLTIDNDFYIHSVGRVFSEGRGCAQGAIDILFKNKRFE